MPVYFEGKRKKVRYGRDLVEVRFGKKTKKEAFAVFSADDNSLNFYKRFDVPKVGERFEGKTVTEVYAGIEKSKFTAINQVPWFKQYQSITKCIVVDEIKPMSTAFWFALTYMTVCDVSKLDTTSTYDMWNMFLAAMRLYELKLGKNFTWQGEQCYPPIQTAEFVPNADGKWYALSDGTAYAPADIPSNKADTYVASKTLLPSASIPTNAKDAGDYIIVKTNNMDGADMRYEWHGASSFSETYGGQFDPMQSRQYRFKVGSYTHASIAVSGGNPVRNGINFHLEDCLTGKVIRSEFLYENATTNFYLPAGTYDLNITNNDPYTHRVSLEFINNTNEILDETTDRILTSKAESNRKGTILYCVVSDASGKYPKVNTNNYIVGSTS